MASPGKTTREILRVAIESLRNDEQGGYGGFRDGKWEHEVVLQFDSDEMAVLCREAGVVPDEIVPNGDCEDCVYGDACGGDLGWSEPCASCSRPKMMNFISVASVTRKALEINEHQAQMLENTLNRLWWATDIVTAEHYSKEWNQQLTECHRNENTLKARDMLVNTLHGLRVTQKGLKALKLRRSRKKAA